MSSPTSDENASRPHMDAAAERAQGKTSHNAQLAKEHMESAKEHMNAEADTTSDKADASKMVMQKEKAGKTQLKAGDPSKGAISQEESVTKITREEKGDRDQKDVTSISQNDYDNNINDHRDRASIATSAASLHAKNAGKETGAAITNAGTAMKEKSQEAEARVAAKLQNEKEDIQTTTTQTKEKLNTKSDQLKQATNEKLDQAKEKSQDLKERAGEAYESAKADLSEKAEHAKEKAQEYQSRAGAKLHSAAESAKGAANSIAASVTNAGETVMHKAQDFGESAKDTYNETTAAIKERMTQATQYVKEIGHAPTRVTTQETVKEEYPASTKTTFKGGQGEMIGHTTVEEDDTTVRGTYERPIMTPGSSSSLMGVSTSVQAESPSLVSNEASLGGYEGISSRDGLAEGAHLASYVQDMSEL